MLVCGRFGWKGIIEFLHVKVNQLTRLFNILSGLFQSGQAVCLNLLGFLCKIFIDHRQLCFNGGRRFKAVHRVSWHSPPKGVLKLNFDGSYVHQICMGGIGGVIRNWLG